MKSADLQKLPLWFTVWWWTGLVLVLPLYVRILWEQTFLTWQQGRQMIGFTMVHQFPIVMFVGFIGGLLVVLWLIAASLFFVRKKRRPSLGSLFYFSLFAVGLLISFVPYDFWAKLGGID